MATKSIEAQPSESLILGTVINYRNAYDDISDLIESADCFSLPENRVAWNAIQSLAKNRDNIDPVSVAAKMRLSGGVDNPASFIVDLPCLTTGGAWLRQHAMKVVEAYIRRETRALCRRYGAVSDSDLQSVDPFEFNEKVIEGLTTVLNQITKVSIRDSGQVLTEFMADLQGSIQAVRDGAKVIGTVTGLSDLDEVLGGFKPQKLYLIAARPAMGKSAFGCCHSPAAIGEKGDASGIVSTEMGRVELMGRMIARDSGVDSFLIQNGTVSDDEMNKIHNSTGRIEKLPIFIEDHNHTMASLLSCIRQMVRRHKCKVVFVDYIQRIMADKSMSRANKNELVGDFAKSLKSIAKELEISVVALAQLSREVERRPLKVPQLADLRDSGELEQEADVVIFMYRPSYYKEKYFIQQHTEIYQYGQMHHPNNASAWLSSLCYFEVAKHRGGKIGRFWCTYDKKTSRFFDIPKSVQSQMGGDDMDVPEVLRPEASDNFPF